MKTRINLWDKYLSEINNSEEIPDKLKIDVAESYRFLRTEFGENFLSNSARGHQLAAKIFNRAPWQLEDLVTFTSTLKILKQSDSNYKILFEKLRSRERCRSEGMPLIELATLMTSVGLKVKIEPIVSTLKKPDLEIINPDNNDRFYGELTLLKDSDDRNKKSNDYLFLFKEIEMQGPYLNFSCKQKRHLDSHQLEYIRKYIVECKSRVVNDNSFQVFENDFIILAFATKDNKEILQKWILEQGLELNHVSGLDLNFDESKRIVNNKIREKAKQLPENYNGLIFIKINPLFFFTQGVENLVPLLQHELEKYPHVLAVLVYSFLGHKTEGGISSLDGAFLALKQVDSLTTRYILFVLNKTTDLKIQTDTLKKIFCMCNS